VDETWLWSCQILRDFVAAQPQWKLIAEHDDRTAVLQKLGNGSETLQWGDQRLVARSGQRKLIAGRVHYRPLSGPPRSGEH
jgi:hypothetical protein